MTVREIFRSNLKYYRKQKGLTQEQLAEAISCNSKYVSEIESRSKFPSAEVIDAIAAALGIPVSRLFEERGSPKNLIVFDKDKFTDEVMTGLHSRLKQDMLDFLSAKIQD